MAHVIEIISEPRSRITISEKYGLIMCGIGAILNIAFTAIGRKAVMVILTGLNTHHTPIHAVVANATDAFIGKIDCNPRARAMKIVGPHTSLKLNVPTSKKYERFQ